MSVEKTAKFLPAFFVDTVAPASEYNGGDLPLHITLFPPLLRQYDPGYGEALRSVVNPQEPFEVIVGDKSLFGERSDIPVRLIEDSDRLHRIHKSLVGVLAELMHDPTFRAPFRPHITLVHDIDIAPGRSVRIGGFAVVEKQASAPWKVVDKIGLKGEI